MNVLLDDISCAELLYPFTSTRSIVDVRVGILTIREKWELLLSKKIQTTSQAGQNRTESTIIPGNVIPSKALIEKLESGEYSESENQGSILRFPWQISQFNDQQIRTDFTFITQNRRSEEIPAGVTIINEENIFIEPGANIQHAIINASTGPVYIGKNSIIMEGSLIRGPFALGEGSLVKMGSKIYGATTAGPYCILGGEIKNSVLFGYSNKAHDGYLGDSVIGEWCNLGAGTSNSNIKNTAGIVSVWDNASKSFMPAGNKVGLMMGDYSRAAINTSFNTGTILGVCCNIFDAGFPPKYIPDFTWGNEKYKLEKAFSDISNWKKMKGHTFTEKEKEILTALYNKQ